MKLRWTGLESICQEMATLAGGGLACWVEDDRGNVLVGTRDDSDRPERHPVEVNGNACGLVCVIGLDAARWARFAATTLSRELSHQNTIGDMADATARAWKNTNALRRMAACSQLTDTPQTVISTVLRILCRATRLEAGCGLVRLPNEEVYSLVREDGVGAAEPIVLAPLYSVGDEVRLVTDDESVEGLRSACTRILDTDRPVAIVRLATENFHFGFLLASAQSVEACSSEDLKMLSSAAKIISVAIENGITLTRERERTRLQVENDLLNEQARDMEEMVHVVAHDLRSPMTALYGFLHVSLDEVKDLRGRLLEEGFAAIGPYADSVAEPLRDGIRSVEKLNRMVQRLLEYSRSARGAYSFEKIELESLVPGVIRSLGYQISKQEIEVVVGELPAVSGDRVQLEAVFGNLVDIAIKYMSEEGERSITVGCESGEEPVYYVRDTGKGMAEDQVAKAFLPFQRFHTQAAPGDGIGLPHVRKIIERHGGRIWCESEKGVGTTFFFTLGDALPEGKIAEAIEISQKQSSQSLEASDSAA